MSCTGAGVLRQTRETAVMAVEELDAVLKRLPRHHLFAEIPAALRGWLLPIDWDRQLLWELALPRRSLGLEELRWHFDLPWWRREGVWFQVEAGGGASSTCQSRLWHGRAGGQTQSLSADGLSLPWTSRRWSRWRCRRGSRA